MSIKKIILPKYKLSQELWNSITHGIGAIFGIVVTILMLLKVTVWGYDGGSTMEMIYRIIGISLYGSGMIICYTISCVYHALAKNDGKRVLRVIDHDTVYLLIAGSYSIYCLTALRNVPLYGIIPSGGWLIFIVAWTGVALGITLNSIDMNKFKIVSFILYIVIGWIIIIASPELINTMGLNGFLLMLAGGLSYTIGSLLYGIGRKKSIWFHTVFHCFILLGTILQFISIWFYILG